MSQVFRCQDCATEMNVSRRHRGRTVPCPQCGARVAIPRNLAFRETFDASVADRRSGYRLLLWAWLSALTCVPVAPAAVWWIASRRMQQAEEDGRVVVDSLVAARLVAATAFFCQLLYLGAGLAKWTFLPLRFFMLDP